MLALERYKRPGAAERVLGRFWSKVWRSPYGCWYWESALDSDGYGVFRFPWGTFKAHRISYELANGPIPDGLTLDHLCRNRRCVRPDHLEAVTSTENIRRSPRCQVTHCKHGHPFSGENLILRDGRRRCRACLNARSRKHTMKKRLGVISIPG